MGDERARIGREEIDKLARLAHLSLTENETKSFTFDLEKILAFAERIQAVDTSRDDPRPAGPAGPGDHPTRDDTPQGCLSREEALRDAPDSGDGLFKVPKVLP